MSSNIEKHHTDVPVVADGRPYRIYTQALCWAVGAGCTALAAVSMLVDGTRPADMSTADLWLGVLPIDVAAAGTAAIVLMGLLPSRFWGAAFGVARTALSPGGVIRRALLTVLWVYPAAAGLTAATTMLLQAMGAPPPTPLLTQMALGQDGAAFWLSLAVATVVIAPVAEEFLFRLVLTESLRELGLTRPAVISAACFAVVHQIPAHVPGLFVLGLVLSRARRQSRGLVLPMTIHALFNGTAVVFLLLARHFGVDSV
jgi:membrane protease YdiL (CAAX protease family)